MSDQDENEVFLSAKHVREWQDQYVVLTAEKTTLTAQIAELQAKLAGATNKIQQIKQKLHMAVPFSPSIGKWLEEQDFSSGPDNVTLTNAILQSFLRVPGGHLLPRQTIQALVPQLGYPQAKLQANPNYLYIALKRLIDRTLIEETPPGSGQYRLTNEGRMEAQKK